MEVETLTEMLTVISSYRIDGGLPGPLNSAESQLHNCRLARHSCHLLEVVAQLRYVNDMSKPLTRQKPGEFKGFNLLMHPELQQAAKEKAASLGVTKSAYLAALIARDTGVPGHELPVEPSQKTKT